MRVAVEFQNEEVIMSETNSNPLIHASAIPSPLFSVTSADNDWSEEDGERAPSASVLTASDLAAGFLGGGFAQRRVRQRDAIDAVEVFEAIRHLNDPEHPLTLEQLNVASLDLIAVDDAASTVDVRFTPTIPHCE